MKNDVVYVPPGERIADYLKKHPTGTPVVIEFDNFAYYTRVPKDLNNGCGEEMDDLNTEGTVRLEQQEPQYGGGYRPEGYSEQMKKTSLIRRPLSSPSRIVSGSLLEQKIGGYFIMLDRFLAKK